MLNKNEHREMNGKLNSCRIDNEIRRVDHEDIYFDEFERFRRN